MEVVKIEINQPDPCELRYVDSALARCSDGHCYLYNSVRNEWTDMALNRVNGCIERLLNRTLDREVKKCLGL